MNRPVVILLVCSILAGLTVVGLWRGRAGQGQPVVHSRQPVGIMGTRCELVAAAGAGQGRLAEEALDQAEAALRAVETRMSAYLEGSEISIFNAARAGEAVRLSPDTLEVLRLAREFCDQSHGAFDVTCRPILQLWKQAGRTDRLPTARQITQATSESGWRWITLLEQGAMKEKDQASIDLGGIAKKYAIDRAVEAMQAAGCTSGLVNVGGDVRCFGVRPGGGNWRIGIRDPFSRDEQAQMAVLVVPEAAVCTSGNYERYVEVQGRRFSHIVDPRTGWPADFAPSVTVVGRDATTAGVWATALSVLGLPGLNLLPADGGLEVMMVIGTPEDHRWYRTGGFDRLLAERPTEPPTELPGARVQTSPATAP